MFLKHFSLNDHPFIENPPVDWLLRDPRIQEAMARLSFFLQQADIALIIGQTGVGKSSLIKILLNEIPQNQFHPLYFHLTPLNANAFLRMIVFQLGEKPKMGKDRLLLQILDKIQQNEKTSLFIIDEAHLIDPQVLTDLRVLISSLAKPSLKILLCGQEGLSIILKRSAHTDLVHRITVKVFLKTLSKDQTAAYIDNRIHRAGGNQKLFDPEAKALIHDYTGGLPRQINNVASACLIHAASLNQKRITESIVTQTMSEFHLP